MNYYILFIFLFLSSILNAQVLLVPHTTVEIREYHEKCRLNGYSCTDQYFINSILNNKSSVFDAFIETLDLYNPSFRANLEYKIGTLLKNEFLDLDQVQLIIQIIQKSNSLENSKNLNAIQKNLENVVISLNKIAENREGSEMVIILKKVLSLEQYLLIQNQAQNLKTTLISPYYMPRSPPEPRKPLLQGDCQRPIYSESITTQESKYVALFSEKCLWFNDNTQSSLTANKGENSYIKPALYTTAGLLLITALTQYKISISF
jgi:hypothetical protein